MLEFHTKFSTVTARWGARLAMSWKGQLPPVGNPEEIVRAIAAEDGIAEEEAELGVGEELRVEIAEDAEAEADNA